MVRGSQNLQSTHNQGTPQKTMTMKPFVTKQWRSNINNNFIWHSKKRKVINNMQEEDTYIRGES